MKLKSFALMASAALALSAPGARAASVQLQATPATCGSTTPLTVNGSIYLAADAFGQLCTHGGGSGGDASAANQTAVQASAGSDASKAQAVQGLTGGKPIGTFPQDGTSLDAISVTGAPTHSAGSITLTANSQTAVYDLQGYAGLGLTVTAQSGTYIVSTLCSNSPTGPWAACPISFNQSSWSSSPSIQALDGTNFSNLVTSNSNGEVQATGRYVQLSTSSFSAGSIAFAVIGRAYPPIARTVYVYIGAGANIIGAAIPAAAATNGSLIAKVNSAATTNATSVATGAHTVYGGLLGNNSASTDACLKFYAKASAPTVGTDTPVAYVYLPKAQTVRVGEAPVGWAIATGLAYAITASCADTDTTAVAASQVVGFIQYQ